MINLDPWLLFDQWAPFIKGGNKYSSKAIDIIDSCLTHQVMSASPKNNRNSSPRKKRANGKYKEFVINKPTAYCPKCYQYVKHSDEGVVCTQCQAYWHYSCADVTQEELDQNWSGIDYLCSAHREVSQKQISSSIIDKSARKQPVPSNNNAGEQDYLNITNIKINSFVLNKNLAIKKKLSDMEENFSVTPKDSKRQYSLKMSTVTYHIFIENIMLIFSKYGYSIKRDDIDETGEMLKTQFNINLRSSDGKNVPISLTCYHTNNSMLVQLKKSEYPLPVRITLLEGFMDNILKEIIKEVEDSSQHKLVKDLLQSQLFELQHGTSNDANPQDIEVTRTDTEQEVLGPIGFPKEPICTSHIDLEGNDDSEFRNSSVWVTNDGNFVDSTSGKDTNPRKHCGLVQMSEPDIAQKDEHLAKNADKNLMTDNTTNIKSDEDLLIINELKIRLDNETKEMKKKTKQIEQLQRKVKELNLKEKAMCAMEEKLEKVMKLKDQMCSAVQSLKQEKEVLNSQHETNSSTISLQKETIQSYTTVITKLEEKLAEKDVLLEEQKVKLKESGIGLEIHREVAYKFMEIGESNETPPLNEDNFEENLKRVYSQLQCEEDKVKNMNREIQQLKSEETELRTKLEESAKNTMAIEEKLMRQIEEQQKQMDEKDQHVKKESKLLKQALIDSEKGKESLTEKVQQLESQLTQLKIDQQIREAEGENARSIVQEEMQNEITNLQALLQEERQRREDIAAEEQKRVDNMIAEDIGEFSGGKPAKDVSVMEKLIQEKETEIEELKRYSVFTDASLAQKCEEVNDLASKLGVLEKENKLTAQNMSMMKAQHEDEIKKREDIQFKYASSQQQIQQLLFLNDQLKVKADTKKDKTKPSSHDGRTDNATCNTLGKTHIDAKAGTSSYSKDHPETGKVNIQGVHQKYCIHEMKETGSCEKIRGKRCNFSHEIPEMGRDEKMNLIWQHNICVKEFQGEGLCHKREDCRFSHDITDSHRNNPEIKGIVERKLAKLRGRSGENEIKEKLCMFEFREQQGCHHGSDCRFSHEITDAHRNDLNLKEKMARKLNSFFQNKSKSDERQENIAVPVDFLQKMYNWM